MSCLDPIPVRARDAETNHRAAPETEVRQQGFRPVQQQIRPVVQANSTDLREKGQFNPLGQIAVPTVRTDMRSPGHADTLPNLG